MIGYTVGQRKCPEMRGLCAGTAKATGRVVELVAVKDRKPVHGGEHEAKEGKRLGQDGRVVRQRGPEAGTSDSTDNSQKRGKAGRARNGRHEGDTAARYAHQEEDQMRDMVRDAKYDAVTRTTRRNKTPELVLRGRKEGYDTLGQSKETTHGRCTTGTEW